MSSAVDTQVLRKYKHRLQICSGDDVIEDGKLVYKRKFIYEGWARIDRRRAQTFSPQGHTILEEKDRRTHFIYMRHNPNVEITTKAWIYEELRKSPPRWFKILFVGDLQEDTRYFLFECRLMEAGDDISEPIISDQKQLGVPEGMHF